jgi:hypothetical protein
MAWGGIFIIVEVVIPNQLFPGGDVAHGKDPDPAFDLVDLTVRIAGVIEIGAKAVAIDYGLAVFQPIQVSAGCTVITAVGFFRSDAFTFVLNNARAFADWRRSVYADRMDGRGANDESHALISHERCGLGKREFDFQAFDFRLPASVFGLPALGLHFTAFGYCLRVVHGTAEALFSSFFLHVFEAMLLLLKLGLHRIDLFLLSLLMLVPFLAIGHAICARVVN